MLEELYRFEALLPVAQLGGVLEGSINPEVAPMGLKADLEAVDKAFKKLRNNQATQKTDYDRELCEVLHKVLQKLAPELRVDMRFWQWLAVKRLPELVWVRWNGEVPTDVSAALSRSGMSDRFLGNRSLRGKNRNALSRLFLTADILLDPKEGYKLAASAFANQDRHTSIFEREMGLVPNVARALVKATKGMGSQDIQKTAKRLNHIGSTIVLDAAEERELLAILK